MTNLFTSIIHSFRQWEKNFSHSLLTHVVILWYAGKRLYLERYSYQVSALSFETLLALVPFFSVILSLISIFPIATHLVNLSQNYILTNFVPASSVTIINYLGEFTQNAARLPKISLLFLFITAMMLTITVKNTLDGIWQIEPRKKKTSTWIFYWLILFLTPFFIGLAVLLSTAIFSMSWFKFLHMQILFMSTIPMLINTLIFATLYTVVSNDRSNWRFGVYGGFIAALLFEGANKGFAYYIKIFPTYEIIYGTLATIPLFLLWLYLSWFIILFGAMVAAEGSFLHKKKAAEN